MSQAYAAAGGVNSRQTHASTACVEFNVCPRAHLLIPNIDTHTYTVKTAAPPLPSPELGVLLSHAVKSKQEGDNVYQKLGSQGKFRSNTP